jgi:hypothetical protein
MDVNPTQEMHPALAVCVTDPTRIPEDAEDTGEESLAQWE